MLTCFMCIVVPKGSEAHPLIRKRREYFGRQFIVLSLFSGADLEEIIRDSSPPIYAHEIELQNLVAVLECISRELLPKRFRDLERVKLVEDIRQLKVLLGERE